MAPGAARVVYRRQNKILPEVYSGSFKMKLPRFILSLLLADGWYKIEMLKKRFFVRITL